MPQDAGLKPRAHHLSAVVDAQCRRWRAATKPSDVVHRAFIPQECVLLRASDGARAPHDLVSVVDVVRYGEGAAERAEVGNHSIPPEERVHEPVRGWAVPDDVPDVVQMHLITAARRTGLSTRVEVV